MPSPGETLLRVERFGCTANNITYAVLGDAVHYWDFFPAADSWGRIPVWGFADVIESASEALEPGARVFGYCPMSTHMVLTPGRVHDSGFADASPHRADLPAAYNAYRRVDADPGHDAGREDQQILLRPVFFLSFLLDDYLADSDDFGADAIVLSSASSKTALGAAFLLGERGAEAIGLTSAANVEFLERLGIYDRVVTYDAVETLPDRAIVFVDVAGNESVRRDVHRHHGADVRHSALVGAAHWEDGRRPAMSPTPSRSPEPRRPGSSPPTACGSAPASGARPASTPASMSRCGASSAGATAGCGSSARRDPTPRGAPTSRSSKAACAHTSATCSRCGPSNPRPRWAAGSTIGRPL